MLCLSVSYESVNSSNALPLYCWSRMGHLAFQVSLTKGIFQPRQQKKMLMPRGWPGGGGEVGEGWGSWVRVELMMRYNYENSKCHRSLPNDHIPPSYEKPPRYLSLQYCNQLKNNFYKLIFSFKKLLQKVKVKFWSCRNNKIKKIIENLVEEEISRSNNRDRTIKNYLTI